jgi:hypothetical protein
MIGIYNALPPVIEAHLINSSDWLRRPDTIQLGCYAEHHEKDDRWEHYVLYAVGSDEHPCISFGAHFGENPWEYMSHSISVSPDDPLKYCGGSVPIMIAVIRYLLLQEKEREGKSDREIAA